VDNLNLETPKDNFDADIIEMANLYLDKIYQLYNIDFKKDEDFFITLLLFIRDLKMDHRIYNTQQDTDIVHEQLIDELEFAFLFQDIADQYLGRYITRTEMQYLAYIMSGAIEFLFETNPNAKLKTVICCHLNPAAYWSLKRQVLGAYDKYLDIVDLLPVNAHHFYDFSNADLILSTVPKRITDQKSCDMIQINTILAPTDYITLSSYVSTKRVEALCPYSNHTLYELLHDAYWHEKQLFNTRFQILDTLTQDFLNNGVADEEQVQLLFRKEAILSAATRPGILFLYIPCPAHETKLSVMTLDHRIKWDTHKIRTIILGAFKKEDLALIFRFNHIFHNDKTCPIDQIRTIKDKQDFCEYFKDF
jgi:lichenan operon transcriptional antiterminator